MVTAPVELAALLLELAARPQRSGTRRGERSSQPGEVLTPAPPRIIYIIAGLVTQGPDAPGAGTVRGIESRQGAETSRSGSTSTHRAAGWQAVGQSERTPAHARSVLRGVRARCRYRAPHSADGHRDG